MSSLNPIETAPESINTSNKTEAELNIATNELILANEHSNNQLMNSKAPKTNNDSCQTITRDLTNESTIQTNPSKTSLASIQSSNICKLSAFPLKSAWKNVTEFWNCLKSLDWKESDNLITLDKGIYWMGNSTWTVESLYIRSHYKNLYNLIFHGGLFQRSIILGNPGIGKTWFLYYILARLSKEPNVSIVFHRGSLLYLFDNHGVYAGSMSQISDVIDLKEGDLCYYLVDGTKPDLSIYEHIKTTILVTAPNRDVYSSFRKDLTRKNTIRYMPIWSLDEINFCRKNIFRQVLEAEVVDLYYKWGGIPRYLFNKSWETAIHELKNSIAAFNLNKLRDYVNRIDDEEGYIHDILHIIVNFNEESDQDKSNQIKELKYSTKSLYNYTHTTTAFASLWVAEQVTARYIDINYYKLLSSLGSSAAIANLTTAAKGPLLLGYLNSKTSTHDDFDIMELYELTRTKQTSNVTLTTQVVQQQQHQEMEMKQVLEPSSKTKRVRKSATLTANNDLNIELNMKKIEQVENQELACKTIIKRSKN